MPKVQVMVGHPLLRDPFVFEIDRTLWNRMQSKPSTQFVMQFKEAVQRDLGIKLPFVSYGELSITETEESKKRPSGCGCACTGCDDQGWHCHKTDKGCYM